MIKLLNKLIITIRGEAFELDSKIPFSYLCSMLWCRLIALINGFFVLGRIIYIAPSSVVKCRSKIRCGKNLSIAKGCHIDAISKDGIRFGNNVSVGKYTTIECSGTLTNLGKGLIVGDRVGLGTHGFFGCAGGVKIGNDTIFGNYVSLHSENHNFETIDVPIRLQGINRRGIKIGNDCWIGAKVTLLDGTIIGDGCIVAAGAVVRGIIPSYSIIGGVPAKILKTRIN